MRIRFRITYTVGLLFFAMACIPAAWAVPASGTFTASQACPAYVSKNNKSNPDNAQTAAGEAYPVIEANKAGTPDWYRLRMPSANPPERWVNVTCGSFQAGSGGGSGGGSSGGGGNSGGAACDVAGQADSFVLALSWQPAFCESKPDKPECKISDPSVYQARHFTLHGLWPNKVACGISYGFCGAVKRQEGNFCNYPPVALEDAARRSLGEVMPSVGAGSCLERHEWHKHGTCQNEWSDDQYFDLAADLTRQFNDAGMAYFMNRKIGQEVKTEDFLTRLAAVLGPNSRDRVKLGCTNGMLVDVEISLPSGMKPGDDLEALMARGNPKSGSNCGASFRVDPIGRAGR